MICAQPVQAFYVRTGLFFLEGIVSDRFIDITSENIDSEHLCCIIRTKKPHSGVETKRAWLRDRLGEGHVFQKARRKGVRVH